MWLIEFIMRLVVDKRGVFIKLKIEIVNVPEDIYNTMVGKIANITLELGLNGKLLSMTEDEVKVGIRIDLS